MTQWIALHRKPELKFLACYPQISSSFFHLLGKCQPFIWHQSLHMHQLILALRTSFNPKKAHHPLSPQLDTLLPICSADLDIFPLSVEAYRAKTPSLTLKDLWLKTLIIPLLVHLLLCHLQCNLMHFLQF